MLNICSFFPFNWDIINLILLLNELLSISMERDFSLDIIHWAELSFCGGLH